LYSDAVAEYMGGRKDPAFLRKLAMMAGQNNDLAGRSRFSADYIQTLKKPYSDADIAFIETTTKKITDIGFAILVTHSQTDRNAYLKVMNIVFADVIQSYVPTPQSNPDWTVVETAVKPFGSAGEEIYLRAKTIHFYNQQNWEQYTPTAKTYLEKYGKNISDQERTTFQAAIYKHKSKD